MLYSDSALFLVCLSAQDKYLCYSDTGSCKVSPVDAFAIRDNYTLLVTRTRIQTFSETSGTSKAQRGLREAAVKNDSARGAI